MNTKIHWLFGLMTVGVVAFLAGTVGSARSCSHDECSGSSDRSRLELVNADGVVQLILEAGTAGPSIRMLDQAGQTSCFIGMADAPLSTDPEETERPSSGIWFMDASTGRSAALFMNLDGSDLALQHGNAAAEGVNGGSGVRLRTQDHQSALFIGKPNSNHVIYVTPDQTVVESWQHGNSIYSEANAAGLSLWMGKAYLKPYLHLAGDEAGLALRLGALGDDLVRNYVTRLDQDGLPRLSPAQ